MADVNCNLNFLLAVIFFFAAAGVFPDPVSSKKGLASLKNFVSSCKKNIFGFKWLGKSRIRTLRFEDGKDEDYKFPEGFSDGSQHSAHDNNTPADPTNVHIAALDQTEAELKWTQPNNVGNSPISGYAIEYMERHHNWLLIKNVGPDVTTAKIDYLKYKMPLFRVRTVNNKNIKSQGAIAKCSFVTPSRPIGLEIAELDKDYVKLKWTKPVNDGGAPIIGYRVDYKTPLKPWTICGATRQTNAKILNIEEGCQYQFHVSAFNAIGSGNPSYVTPMITAVNSKSGGQTNEAKNKNDQNKNTDKSSSTTEKSPDFDSNEKGCGKPSAPTLLLVNSWIGGRVKIDWKEPENDGGSPITNYVIELKTQFDEEWDILKTVDGNTKSDEIPNIYEGTVLRVRIAAVNKAGVGQTSNVVLFIAKHIPHGIRNRINRVISNYKGVLDEPTGLEVTRNADGKRLHLKWTRPKKKHGQFPIIGYLTEYEYYNVFNTYWNVWKTIRGDVTEADIDNVAVDCQLVLRIRAINKLGAGKPSIESEQFRGTQPEVPKCSVKPTIDNSDVEDKLKLGEYLNLSKNQDIGEEIEDFLSAEEELVLLKAEKVETPEQISHMVKAHFPDRDKVYCRFKNNAILLTGEDFTSLRLLIAGGRLAGNAIVNGEWLTDSVINAYLQLLTERYAYFSYLITNASQSLTLTSVNDVEMEASITDGLNDVQVGKTKKLFVPLGNNQHWQAMLIDLDSKLYYLLNPMITDGPVSENLLKRIERFLRMLENRIDTTTKIRRRYLTTFRQQNDRYNCGVFVCWYAKQFAVDGNLDDLNFSPTTFRAYIFNELFGHYLKQRPRE